MPTLMICFVDLPPDCLQLQNTTLATALIRIASMKLIQDVWDISFCDAAVVLLENEKLSLVETFLPDLTERCGGTWLS